MSIGSTDDELVVEIVEPDFFSSSTSGTKIPVGFEITNKLPRMVQSKEFKSAVNAVNTGIQIGIIA